MARTILLLLAVPTALASPAHRRRLSYERILSYAPGSQVTDHAAIDLDQAAIETNIGLSTEQGFAAALAIYSGGGYSKSYAEVLLASPLSCAAASKGNVVTGTALGSGGALSAKLYDDYAEGATTLKLQYTTSDVQATYVGCQVGELPVLADGFAQELSNGYQYTQGCFEADGSLAIACDDGSSVTVAYSYEPTSDNDNGRTINGFSTGAEAKMYNDCPGCPYKDFKMFYDYYGSFDYASKMAIAALEGTSTGFGSGRFDQDFSGYSVTDGSVRAEVAKKASAYMTTWMYVIREFEDAIDDCQVDCINCNDDPVHAWDEGVAFYAGSALVGGDGSTDIGVLSYALANKRCIDYKTCGTAEGGETSGIAKVNYELFTQFALGQHELLIGNCAEVGPIKDRIVDLMTVPLVQGTMRYAYKMAYLSGADKEMAEGAVFAAAVLPRLHHCNAADAQTVAANLALTGTLGIFPTVDYLAVKAAFENNYACLNITCADVGGLYNEASGEYYEFAGPCVDAGSAEELPVGALFGIVIAAIVGVVLLVCVCVFAKSSADKGKRLNMLIEKYEGGKAAKVSDTAGGVVRSAV